jgi:hypothetical protein
MHSDSVLDITGPQGSSGTGWIPPHAGAGDPGYPASIQAFLSLIYGASSLGHLGHYSVEP